ncbi:MAG: MFS transporter [Actinomycetota bacterium]|nr:MFS transporter [Actinomycetota bacterium]
MRRLLLFVATVVFFDTVFYSAITPLLPDYARALDLSKTEAGVLAAGYPAGTFLGALPAGWFASRVGVRPTVLAGLGITAVSSVVFAFGETIAVLDVARFVQGVGGAASWAGALAWLIRAAPAQRRGELIGFALGAAIAGALVGPLVGAAAELFSAQIVFSLIGMAALVMVGWALRMPPVVPENSGFAGLRACARDTRVIWGMWLVALPGVLFGTLGVLGPLRLDALGASTVVIAGIFLLAAGLEAAVSPLAGRASDRHGRFVPALIGVSASAVLIALVPLPQSVPGLAVILLMAAPAIGLLWAPALALLSEGAERHGLAQGMAFSLTNLAWAAGQSAGAAGSARISEWAGDVLVFVFLACLCAVSATVIARAARAQAAVSARTAAS